jgi:hypothetical protein
MKTIPSTIPPVFAREILNTGIGWTGLTVTAVIQRSSDSKYWNETSNDWQVGTVSNAVTAIGQGLYKIVTDAAFFGTPFTGQVTVLWTALNGATTVHTGGEEFTVAPKTPATIAAGDIATDAITAASVKADAVTKIQVGLATGTNLATVDTVVDSIKAKTDTLPASPAAVGSAMTLTSAYDKAKDDVLTPLAVVDTVVDSIKALCVSIENTLITGTAMDKVVLRNNLRLLMDKIDKTKTSQIVDA